MSERHAVPGMTERNYGGVYPSSSAVLNDGSPVVLYNGRKRSSMADGLVWLELAVVRVTAAGPSAPVVIATHAARDEPPVCPFTISNSLAYDRTHDVLYVAYNDVAPGYCAVMLAKSGDKGQTWSPPHELQLAGESHSAMYFPVLAVNQDGVLGLLWRGKPERSPDCWFFSTSRDGLTLDNTIPLSRCVSGESLDAQSSAYLTTVISQSKEGHPVSVDMLTFRDYLTRVGIATSLDGAFHPIWSTLGDGPGELRTARIRIGDTSQSRKIETVHTPALADVTDKIAVLYGGKQRLDHETRTVMIDLSFRNISRTPIEGPLFLMVEGASSDFGRLELVNRAPPTLLGAEYLDLSAALHHSSLAPNDKTSAYQLTFRFSTENSALLRRYFVLRVKLRFFCRSFSVPHEKVGRNPVLQNGGPGS